MNPEFSAVLLAGGESRRMGRDKATLTFAGETLWRRQLELLRSMQPARLFLSARADQLWRPRDVELLLDRFPDCGPLAGIAAALDRMDTMHLLVLAVDMPFVTRRDLQRLISLIRPGGGVVPIAAGRAEPLAAIYPKETMTEVNLALAEHRFAVHDLIRTLATKAMLTRVELTGAEAARYRSLNTPAELISAIANRALTSPLVP